MARRPRLFAPGVIYHVIARGNHQEAIFLRGMDYHAYLLRLALYQGRDGVRLYAYCLMPNHVHLLLRAGGEPLSRFMQSLQQSHAQRFNRLYDKVGHLFQGRYTALICDTDEYLVTLVRYIHRNPVEAGLAKVPGAYPYSSHRPYCRGLQTAVVDPVPVLNMLGGPAAYRRLVSVEDASSSGDGDPLPFPLLGKWPVRLVDVGFPASEAESQASRPLQEEVVSALATHLGVDPARLADRDRGWRAARARAILALILVRHAGYRVADVAARLGRHPTSISVVVARLRARLEADAGLAGVVARLAAEARARRDC